MREFGESRVFMDIDASIPPGQDFVEFIEESVSSCDVLIALIGKRWLTARRARQRRIDDPIDFVRLEIETALKREIPVISPALAAVAAAPRPETPDKLGPVLPAAGRASAAATMLSPVSKCALCRYPSEVRAV